MTNLSPAAQAVLDAVMQYEINPECYSREIAAAALRAVADQVVPVLTTAEGARINDSIEAIAAELEAQQ
jgi:predicted oxidoreductase